MLKLIGITEVKSEKKRSDKKVSRQYYTAEFADQSNPFAKTVKRNFFQTHNADGSAAEWRGASPEAVTPFIGKEIPGAIVSKAVEAYTIGEGADQRDASTYTTIVLGNENIESVFKGLGHPLAGTMQVAEKSNASLVG